MKSRTVQIRADLLAAAEAILRDNESLSAFVEASLQESISCRVSQNKFLARGLAGRDEARRTGKYFSSPEVLAKLDAILQVRRGDRT